MRLLVPAAKVILRCATVTHKNVVETRMSEENLTGADVATTLTTGSGLPKPS